MIQKRIRDFFSERSVFISPNEHQNAVFLRVAKCGVKIPLLVLMSEIRSNLILKESDFLFRLCFKIAVIQFLSNTSAFMTETHLFSYPFRIEFDASSVFTGYDIGC